MDTIVRNEYGWVKVFPTVVKTIIHLVNTQPGTYRIDDIRRAINVQLEPKEQFTRRMIVKALVKLAEMQKH